VSEATPQLLALVKEAELPPSAELDDDVPQTGDSATASLYTVEAVR